MQWIDARNAALDEFEILVYRAYPATIIRGYHNAGNHKKQIYGYV
jgi:hypothetical protein